MNKRKEAPTPIPVADVEDVMRVTPLGGGSEVGRSCILIEFKGKKVMLDCGLHPGLSGLAALPFFDDIDPSSIDLLLVHAAGVPYFMQKTAFKGQVFMTHPTRAIYKWMLSDYVKVSNLSSEDMLYNEADLLNSFDRIKVVDYHQTVEVNGIKFTSYNAGHVLGAAMFLLEIAGVRVLYTGDYSREEDRHLMAAERPRNVVPEVLICESTYGVQSHQPRNEREALFTGMVHRVVGMGGRCLIPVFALGRAQELLLILDEYWQAHPELHNVPIYYASSLAKKCMTVYQTYTNMMNDKIKKQIKTSNPFLFKHISNLKSIGHFDDVGPCVMMASPGMLQSGLSRELLELWCPDKRNGLIIPGYVVEGTLAKTVLSQPDEITSMSGSKLPLKLSVEYISFSAHVDYQQNSAFIQEVASPNLILVHGDANEMGRLRSALEDRYIEKEVALKIYTPKNCQTVELYFRGEKMAKTLGSLAANEPVHDQILEGILVSRDFQFNIISPAEISEYTHDHLFLSSLKNVQEISCNVQFSLIKYHLECMYGSIEIINQGQIKVFGVVDVWFNEGKLGIEWEGNSVNDMIADSVLAVVLQAETSPASVKVSSIACNHSHGSQDHESEKETKSSAEKDPRVKEAVKDIKKEDVESDSKMKKVDDTRKKIEIVEIESEPLQSSEVQSIVQSIVQSSELQSSTALQISTEIQEYKFAFYAQMFLSCQFGPENVEYTSQLPPLTSEIAQAISQDITKIKQTLESKIEISDRKPIEMKGHVWMILFDGVVCVLGCQRGKVQVECDNLDLGNRVTGVASRIVKTLLPISETWTLHSGLSR